MASILSHPAVSIGLSIALGRGTISRRLTLIAVVCSILPDIDALGFRMGIAYGDVFGHRGFTHSLLFASLVGVAGAFSSAKLGASRRLAFLVLFLCTASHGILDAMSNGGLGVAFFSPFSNHRYFLPWRIIEVSPIGISAFFSSRGLVVLASEAQYVWGPCIVLGLLGLVTRRLARHALQGDAAGQSLRDRH